MVFIKDLELINNLENSDEVVMVSDENAKVEGTGSGYICKKKNYYQRLFSMINDMATVFEVVAERKPVKDKPTAAESGSKAKRSSDGQVKSIQKPVEESFEDEEDEHGDTQCGCCGRNIAYSHYT